MLGGFAVMVFGVVTYYKEKKKPASVSLKTVAQREEEDEDEEVAGTDQHVVPNLGALQHL